ncbi:MAG: ATPase, T2SS/T4P/T4SS family, partial [Halioglobus sp.]|nr:ATPase, T2SS/T4P/T4SS family [Halioglobus sp.]
QAHHSVLVIGTGAGYVAALLSKLAERVIAVENNPTILRLAQDCFNRLGLANLVLRKGDGTRGAPDLAPFDRIFVASPKVTVKSDLIDQLADEGQLLAMEQGENDSLILARYGVSQHGVSPRRELALVDFSRDSGITLLDMGVVDQVMLSEARRTARRKKIPVIKALRDKLNLEDTTLYCRLAAENGMPFAPLEELLSEIQPDLMNGFSHSFLDSHHLIPVKVEGRSLHVATDDPDASVDDIYHMYPYDQVLKILVTPNDFKRLWTTVELSQRADARQVWEQLARQEEQKKEEAEKKSKKNKIEAHLVTLLDALLLDAVSEGASDLHIEQFPSGTRFRLRVDGDLHDITHYSLSREETRGLINVIKIRGKMDIAEKRLPQGGRSQLTANDVTYDLRIQIQPSLNGEAVVIRILPQSGNIVAIEDLGMNRAMMQHYRRLLDNPSGLVLVVGPTGSGKSTTLYAGLTELAKDGRRKVLTIEDPIEYSIEGIQQTWARPDIGFTFADGMRSFVRLDPDVILVGEIRDTETAVEAIRASQTGHVVLSTLHSNDAVDAVQRIYDLNVHANSVASELMGVIAQKLAKRICPDCKVEAEPDEAILEELFPEGTPGSFRSFVGTGCDSCSGRGTRGRVAVVEYMRVNDDIRNAISQQYPIDRLRAIALDSGLTTMRDSALSHVVEGVIPVTELPRILPSDRMAPEKRGAW